MASSEADSKGVSPPDLEPNKDFTAFPEDLSIDRIRAETTRYLTDTYSTLHHDHVVQILITGSKFQLEYPTSTANITSSRLG